MYILATILLAAAAALVFFTWPVPVPHRAPGRLEMSDLDAAHSDPIAVVREQIHNKHPATCFVLAQRLLATDEKDEAAFWFYVGVIRYRAYLTAVPDTREAERFGALWDAVEPLINDHACADGRHLAAAIGRALAWDERHVDPYASRGAREPVRRALARLRREVLAHRGAVPRDALAREHRRGSNVYEQT